MSKCYDELLFSHFGIGAFEVLFGSSEDLMGRVAECDGATLASGADARSSVDGIADERELRFVIADDAEDAVAVVDANFDLKVLACAVGEFIDEGHHVDGEVECACDEVALSKLWVESGLDELEAACGHVSLANGLREWRVPRSSGCRASC